MCSEGRVRTAAAMHYISFGSCASKKHTHTQTSWCRKIHTFSMDGTTIRVRFIDAIADRRRLRHHHYAVTNGPCFPNFEFASRRIMDHCQRRWRRRSSSITWTNKICSPALWPRRIRLSGWQTRDIFKLSYSLAVIMKPREICIQKHMCRTRDT